jgi:hypothetical protein
MRCRVPEPLVNIAHIQKKLSELVLLSQKKRLIQKVAGEVL